MERLLTVTLIWQVEQLQRGKMISRKSYPPEGGARGEAAQLVHAPAGRVFECIGDFASWPGMVDNVTSARVYEQRGPVTKVEVVLGVAMINIKTYVKHVIGAAHPSAPLMKAQC